MIDFNVGITDSRQSSVATIPIATVVSDEFDEDDCARGDRVRRIVALTVLRAIFEVGPELSAAFDKFNRMNLARGRNSCYGRWLQTYLPQFDRKTLDRWRRAYELFAPLVADEIRTHCLDFFNGIELSVIYALCRLQVSDEQRLSVIKLAKSGQVIDMKALAHLLPPTPKTLQTVFQKSILLPAGKVSIVINHDDFRQALVEAIGEIDDETSEVREAAALLEVRADVGDATAMGSALIEKL